VLLDDDVDDVDDVVDPELAGPLGDTPLLKGIVLVGMSFIRWCFSSLKNLSEMNLKNSATDTN